MTVSTVVGVGYVGEVLARRLSDRGHDVYGVSRSGVDIDGVESIKADVTSSDLTLPDSDYVFYLVSAGSRDTDDYREAYVEGQRNVIDVIDSDSTLIYSSSTGVYETTDGSRVDETTEIEGETRKTRVLLEAEELTRQNSGTVVRFAGLYGPGRYGLDRYLADEGTDTTETETETTVPAGYLNLLHRQDAARALEHVAIRDEADDDLYLACDDEPVERHELARWLAEKTGRETGRLVDETKGSNKRCSNDRLRSTGWEPEYSTFRDGYSDSGAV
ncbi:MAG: NAD-dependent epimerase/dehydratase family protein [Halobacteria archaeon]|nr:NAD-dependent epimerase/dehydratase family protein [Halobacteria archaeon]